MSKCKKCKGSKHVFSKKTHRWKKCKCLRADRALARYKEAKLPARASSYSWKDYDSTYTSSGRSPREVVSEIIEGSATPWCIASGSPPSGLLMLADLATKTACDARMSSKVLSLGDFVDAEFDRSDSCSHADYSIRFLCLMLGYEAAHKWNSHIVEKIVRVRWRNQLPTIIIAERGIAFLEKSYASAIFSEFVQATTKITVRKK